MIACLSKASDESLDGPECIVLDSSHLYCMLKVIQCVYHIG